jgi:hypothetical protein
MILPRFIAFGLNFIVNYGEGKSSVPVKLPNTICSCFTPASMEKMEPKQSPKEEKKKNQSNGQKKKEWKDVDDIWYSDFQ